MSVSACVRCAYRGAAATAVDLKHHDADLVLSVCAVLVGSVGYLGDSAVALGLGVLLCAAAWLVTAAHRRACRPCPRSLRGLYAARRAAGRTVRGAVR